VRRAKVAAPLALVLALLPVFLVGALGVFISQDLGADSARLGAAVTAFFLAAALGSVPGGLLVERIGPRRGLLLASGGTAVALLLISGVVRSWGGLAAALVLAGLVVGTADAAANATLSRTVPDGSQGWAFGVKEAAIPTATLLGGLAVPGIALTVGWRWAFAGASLLAVVLWPLAPHPPQADGHRSVGRHRGRLVRRGPLVVVAVGAACATAANTNLGIFLVETAVARGVMPGPAGLLLAFGSVAGISARLVAGRRADRAARDHLRTVQAMIAAGSLGFLAIALADGSLLLTGGALLGFACGWGWSGLLFFATVRLNRAAPAAATGIVVAGLSLGAALGPAMFATVISFTSLRAAWVATAAIAAFGAGLLHVGRRLVGRTADPTGQTTGQRHVAE
jgi:MFS family permease